MMIQKEGIRNQESGHALFRLDVMLQLLTWNDGETWSSIFVMMPVLAHDDAVQKNIPHFVSSLKSVASLHWKELFSRVKGMVKHDALNAQ